MASISSGEQTPSERARRVSRLIAAQILGWWLAGGDSVIENSVEVPVVDISDGALLDVER